MTKEEQLKHELAQIPDQELHDKCTKILSDICQHGMKKFTMCVPVHKDDSDMLIGELLRRFQNQININNGEKKAN